MITDKEKEAFQSRGLILLKGLLPAEKVSHAQESLFAHLEKAGIRENGAWQLESQPPSDLLNAGAHLLKGFSLREGIAPLLGEEIDQVVRELLDGHETAPQREAGHILFTLPNAERWTLPHQNWHADLPRFPQEGAPGVQIFTFLDKVEPGGGGTLVVAGSHRLVNEGRRIRSQDVKKTLVREPYFRGLFSDGGENRQHFLQEVGSVGEVELQVVELYGDPGDVYFMDVRLLHTIAPNASRVPRIMLTQLFLLRALQGAVMGENGS